LKDLGYDVLLVAPGGAGSTAARLSFKRSLYAVADAKNLPLVDFTALIGSSGTSGASAPYMTDNLHENQRGYNYESTILARVLAT
ncbi:hypothetical protein NL351_27655, partial [Klebsiella pneumoniae]|nr:hypothetical protein [Klebsiella pneumoniae]